MNINYRQTFTVVFFLTVFSHSAIAINKTLQIAMNTPMRFAQEKIAWCQNNMTVQRQVPWYLRPAFRDHNVAMYDLKLGKGPYSNILTKTAKVEASSGLAHYTLLSTHGYSGYGRVGDLIFTNNGVSVTGLFVILEVDKAEYMGDSLYLQEWTVLPVDQDIVNLMVNPNEFIQNRAIDIGLMFTAINNSLESRAADSPRVSAN